MGDLTRPNLGPARLVEQAGFDLVHLTGYGGPLNVVRTVREYAAAGVAALHVEDQVTPKRCGHMEGKRVVPTAELGFRIMFSSLTALLAATSAIQERLAVLRDATAPQPEPPLAFDAFNEVVGLSETQDLEGRLASAR